MTARSGLVPALGTARRLRALVALGWPPAVLRARSGLLVELLVQVDGVLVTAETAARAAALYERLSGTPGRSQEARAIAAAWDWMAPLAWDDGDLDDPDAQGNRGVHRRRKAAA